MGLGADAWVIATHLVRVAVLGLLAWRVMATFRHAEVLAEAERRGLSAAAALACVALILERAWAVAVRWAYAQGADLMAAHPMPEIVGLMTTLGLYAIGLPLLVAAQGAAAGRRRAAGEVATFAGLWAGLALVLR